MAKNHRILFMLPAFYGHLAPSITIAKQLISKGHTIGYCTGPPARELLTKIGITDFYPREAYHDAIMDKQNTLVKWWYQFWYKYPRVFTSSVMEKCYQELIKAVESFKPDVIYVDTYDIFGANIAERYNIPYVHGSATTILYLEKDIPPFATNWKLNTPWRNRFKYYPFLLFVTFFMFWAYLNERKALKAIDPAWRRKVFNLVSPYLYLYFSTDKVEYPRKTIIPQIYYVGPCILEPEEDQLPDFPWERLDKNLPLIYIATGTLLYNNYKKFYKNALNALSEKNFPIPVQVVMAMGSQELIDELGEVPSNFIVVSYAPQIKLLPKASVCITHGGVNSVNETFMHGKPMLIVHWGGDRIDVSRRVENINAGIGFDVDDATPERIKNAVIQLLQNSKYRQASERIMHQFQACNGPKTSAYLINRLAETRSPILRKKGAPITFENTKDFENYIEK